MMQKQDSDLFAKFVLPSLFSVFIILIIISIHTLRNAEYFPIKNVDIFGAQYTNHQAVEHLLTPYIKNGFFAVDVDLIKEQLLELPWAAEVSVRRLWPNNVIVVIHEKLPFAKWNNTSLLSANGELFTPPLDSFPDQLPQLFGPEGEHIVMMQYFSTFNSLFSALHLKISKLELTPSLLWVVTLDNGMKLTLGSKDILTRLSHFVKVYPKIVGDRVMDVDYIDLRYSNGLAVRWKSVTNV